MQLLQVFRPVLFPAANEHDPKPLQCPRQSTISFAKRTANTGLLTDLSHQLEFRFHKSV